MKVASAQTGPVAFLVKEQRFAMFVRLGGDQLVGIMGADLDMVSALQLRFDMEFTQAKLRYRRG